MPGSVVPQCHVTVRAGVIHKVMCALRQSATLFDVSTRLPRRFKETVSQNWNLPRTRITICLSRFPEGEGNVWFHYLFLNNDISLLMKNAVDFRSAVKRSSLHFCYCSAAYDRTWFCLLCRKGIHSLALQPVPPCGPHVPSVTVYNTNSPPTTTTHTRLKKSLTKSIKGEPLLHFYKIM